MDFPLTPLRKLTVVSMLAIAVVIPLVMFGTLVATGGGMDAAVRAGGIALVIGAMLFALVRRRSVTLEHRTLIVKAAFYSRRRHVDELDLDKARVVDLDERSELRPILRVNGASLPGFHAGHYRLRNLERAFCMLTGRQKVVVLPERDGKLIMLSVERPQALLDALRSRIIAATTTINDR